MHIELTDDEAVVLYELLARHEDDLHLDIRHEAERIVLWRIGGALELALVAPLRPEYAELVRGARERIHPG
jgi:hypothetical protein